MRIEGNYKRKKNGTRRFGRRMKKRRFAFFLILCCQTLPLISGAHNQRIMHKARSIAVDFKLGVKGTPVILSRSCLINGGGGRKASSPFPQDFQGLDSKRNPKEREPITVSQVTFNPFSILDVKLESSQNKHGREIQRRSKMIQVKDPVTVTGS